MTPSGVVKNENLKSVSKAVQLIFLVAEINKLKTKKFLLTVSSALSQFAVWLLLYGAYKATKKSGHEMELEDVIEAELLKVLDKGYKNNKEEFIALVRSMAPPWSKELKEVLEDVAEEALQTYELKKTLESNKELLDSFLSQVKNATDSIS